MTEVVFILIMLLVFFAFSQFNRHKFQKARANSTKLIAVVVEYRRERMKSMRSQGVKLDYPYVKIKGDDSSEIICLQHASSTGRAFAIGEEVDVFWYGDKLVKWNL